MVLLARHKLHDNILGCLAGLAAAVLQLAVLNVRLDTWRFVDATLWIFLDPNTAFASELPDVIPNGRNILALAFAAKVANENTVNPVAFIVGIWSLWNGTLQVPLACASLIPFTCFRIANH